MKAITIRTSLDSSFFGAGLPSGFPGGSIGELIVYFDLERLSGHQVGSAGMERMAAPKAFHSQPHSPGSPVNFDRFAHVIGACRIKAAG